MSTFPQRYASSIARRPGRHLTAALLLSMVLSIIVVTKGNLHIDAPGLGWLTKGTVIANRAAQVQLTNEILRGEERGGELKEGELKEGALYCSGKWYGSDKMLDPHAPNFVSFWKIPDMSEKSALDADALYEMCRKQEHTLNMLRENDLCHKCPIDIDQEERCIQPYSLVGLARLYILVQQSSLGFGDFELDHDHDLDITEHLLPSVSCAKLRQSWSRAVQSQFEKVLLECTNYLLEEKQLKPASNADYSECKNFPMMAASLVDDQFVETGRVQYTTSIFATKNDAASIKSMYYLEKANQFRAYEDEISSFEDELHDVGMNTLYLTPKQGFYELLLDENASSDVGKCLGGLLVAAICVLIHSSSPFLTILGMVQILLTLPVGYFVYYFICGVNFFPLINLNSIFVLSAVGADDIFVVVDKWKAIRQELSPDLTTEQVAVYALPKIALATFVTSITTAAAFFASAGIKIPIVASFVIFSGLLVTMDYFLSIIIFFPALCMYDNWLTKGCKSRWLRLCESSRNSMATPIESNPTIEMSVDGEKNEREESEVIVDTMNVDFFADEDNAIEVATKDQLSFSQPPRLVSFSPLRNTSQDQVQALQNDEAKDLEVIDTYTIVLSSYYKILHFFRWPILLLTLAAFIVCSIVASEIQPAYRINPAILPSSYRYEKHRQWSFKLLAAELLEHREVLFVWGLTPTDTSRRIDPNQSSKLVFDEAFDPSTESAQVYLFEQCETVYHNSNNYTFFRRYARGDEECFLKGFNDWLETSSQSASPSDTYNNSCLGANGIPVSPEIFHQCLIAYTNRFKDKNLVNNGIFHDEGIVKLYFFTAKTQTSFASPTDKQERQLEALEGWTERERETALEETKNFFFSSVGSHLTDSLRNMMSTSRASIGIATACVGVMILFTSQSVTVTALSAISAGYVFVSTIACLVGLGWTLGIFESILFAIAIGIGSDYVLHASHSYSITPDSVVSREDRTRHAVLHIGRPIIGSAFTTISTALMMMLAENQFSRKFAAIILVTIIQALIGSFVVFFALCDCFAPNANTRSSCVRQKLCRRQQQQQQQS